MDMQINAKRIKQERERRAWSQNQLAEVAELSVRTVQRIEKSGIASYESVQALASVFELKADELIADRQSAYELKRTILQPFFRQLGGGFVGALITVLGFLVWTNVYAEQIIMDVSYSLDGMPSEDFSLVNDLDAEAEFKIDERFRVVVIPELLRSGKIKLSFDVFERQNGRYELVSQPKIITDNEQTATIIVNHQEQNELTVEITPNFGIL